MQIGPYQVQAEIARGGMGVVYRARDAAGATVALKLLHTLHERGRKRFATEVGVLSRLKHPHVVRILGTGVDQGVQWLALDYVEGESLAERLRRGPLPAPEALRIAQQLAQALAYVHSCGVLHRDLKPDNVLLRGGQPLLTDFGLALDEGGAHSRVTATGVSQGTPGFWAPEQALGQTARFGPHTDLYGLGAVLYACLTGRAPVEGQSLQAHLSLESFRRIEPPRTLRPGVPRWLSELCMRCLAVEPAVRPPSADVLARELLLGGQPAAASRSRALLAGALAVGLCGVAAGVVLWSTSGDPSAAAPLAEAPEGSGLTPPAPPPASAVDEADLARARGLLAEGESLLMGHQDEAALATFDRALELTPRDPELLALRGAACSRLKRYAEALADFDLAFELGLVDVSLCFNRAFARSEVGRFAEAIEDYTRGLELQPGDLTARVQRGCMHAATGNYAAALADFERALELDPTHRMAYVNRAIAHGEQRHYAEAAADFARALELDPSDARSWTQRGQALSELGRHAEAIECFDASERLEPGQPRNLFNRAFVKANLGDHAGAIPDFGRALELDPTYAEGYSLRGESWFALGQLEQALADFDRSLQVDAEHSEAYANRGLVYSRLARHEEAIADYTRALELGDRRVKLYRNRAGARVNVGRYREAIDDYDEAIRLEPSNPNAYAFRGFAKRQLGRTTEAREDWEAARRRSPSPKLLRQIEVWQAE